MLKRPNPILDGPILAPLKALYKGGRAAITGALHPLRRREARRRVLALGPARRLLVMCTGNICRSPYAEAKIRHSGYTGIERETVSAGFLKAGRPSPPEAQSVAGDRGLDLRDHRSQTVTAELAEWADLVVVMSEEHASRMRGQFGIPSRRILLLGDLDPEKPQRRMILDPFERPREDFVRSFDRIDRCLEELLRLLDR